jgi:hypothetical protein
MTIGKAGSGQNLGFFSKKDFHFPFTTLKSSKKSYRLLRYDCLEIPAPSNIINNYNMATDSPAHKSSRKRKAGKIFLAVVILIVVIRLILPYVVLHFANKSLAGMNGYYGHIKDIDLAIIRGAYKIDSIYINKADTLTGKQTPFFASSEIDLSVEWATSFTATSR